MIGKQKLKSKRSAFKILRISRVDSSVRLHPILMTTAAMVLGVLPLVIASGAGAAGRNAMGLVIFTGLSIGTLFTLFVVPAMVMFLAADHHREMIQE
jgi:multidrug efflux pump